MTGTVYRLLGPFHNRLVTVIDDPDPKLGQISHETAAQLVRSAGWTIYRGPAREKAGWVVPGTDGALRPRRVQIS